MYKAVIVLFLLVIGVSCNDDIKCHLDTQVLKSNDSILLKLETEKSFSKFLQVMEVSELRTFSNENYRFVIADAWGGIQSYTINWKPDNITISSKRYWSYYYGQKVDSLGKENIKVIDESNWKELTSSLDDLNYWSLPVIDEDNRYVLDGTAYIIERYSAEKNECTNRSYHLTSRISPRDTTIYNLLFDKVIKLSSQEED